MFALIIDGQIASLADTAPTPPDPLPDGYVAPDYRPVVEGTMPPKTSLFSAIIPRAMDQWTIQPSQVIRIWDEVFPSINQIKASVMEKCEKEHGNALSSEGITVSGITLAGDEASLAKFTGKAVMLDLGVRNGALSLSDMTSLYDINGNPVPLTVQQAIGALLQYGAAYEDRLQQHKSKVAQIKAATTVQQIERLAGLGIPVSIEIVDVAPAQDAQPPA